MCWFSLFKRGTHWFWLRARRDASRTFVSQCCQSSSLEEDAPAPDPGREPKSNLRQYEDDIIAPDLEEGSRRGSGAEDSSSSDGEGGTSGSEESGRSSKESGEEGDQDSAEGSDDDEDGEGEPEDDDIPERLDLARSGHGWVVSKSGTVHICMGDPGPTTEVGVACTNVGRQKLIKCRDGRLRTASHHEATPARRQSCQVSSLRGSHCRPPGIRC